MSTARRHGGDDIEVLWVEDIAGYESDRVCLPRRSEKFVSEVREFCKYNTSNEVEGLKRKKETTLV